ASLPSNAAAHSSPAPPAHLLPPSSSLFPDPYSLIPAPQTPPAPHRSIRPATPACNPSHDPGGYSPLRPATRPATASPAPHPSPSAPSSARPCAAPPRPPSHASPRPRGPQRTCSLG